MTEQPNNTNNIYILNTRYVLIVLSVPLFRAYAMSFSKFQEIVKDREAWHAIVSPWVAKSRTQLNN